MSINAPAVFVNNESAIALVHNVTASTISAITFEGDVKVRAVEFLKNYKPLELNNAPYPPARAALKIINNRFQTPSDGAIKILKGIINMESTIITVTKTGEFLGRFPDVQTAADVSPEDALIIASPADFDTKAFTKAALFALITPAVEGLTADSKKADLAVALFAQYSGTPIEIKEPVKKTRAAKLDAKPRERSHKDRLRDLLNAGAILSEQDILAQVYNDGYETTAFTVRTAINNLKTEKHAGKEGVLDIISGKVDGVRVYCLATTVVTFDATAKDSKAEEKAAKAAERAAAKQAKIDTKNTAKNVTVDEEIDNSDQQLDLPIEA